MTEKTQLDRIEEKLDAYAKETAMNTTDLKWVKRGIHGLGSVVAMVLVHLLRKAGVSLAD